MEIEKRLTERTVMIEAGRAQHIDSTAPGDRRAMLQLRFHDCNLE